MSYAALLLALALPARALSPVYPRAVLPAAPLGVSGISPAAALPAPTASPARAAPTLPAPLIGAVPAAASAASPDARLPPGSLDLLRRYAEELGAARQPSLPFGGLYDGAAPAAPFDAETPELPAFLAAKPADRDTIALAAAAAMDSETGRRVLRRAERLVERRGRPIEIGLRDLKGNWGEYDYMKDRLDLDARFREDPELAAPTLVHELLHVLQHELGIPAEALEMELEAHLVTLRVMKELGIEADSDTFSAKAAAKLAESPEAYVRWMKEQHPGKVLLLGSDFETIEGELEEEQAHFEERSSARARSRLEWVLRDLELVRSPQGRRRYRSFARRVKDALARAHRQGI